MGIPQDNNNLVKAALSEQWGKFHRIIMGKIGKSKVISYGVLAVTSTGRYFKETWSN